MPTKNKDIREKSTEQLGVEMNEKLKHLFNLRSQAVTEKLEDPSQLGKTRREIARLKTIIRERSLAVLRLPRSADGEEEIGDITAVSRRGRREAGRVQA